MGSTGGYSRKSHQENVPWNNYHWSLCVSYLKLDYVAFPLSSPITCCDDAVQKLDTELNYFISVYIYSGYWKVLSEEDV